MSKPIFVEAEHLFSRMTERGIALSDIVAAVREPDIDIPASAVKGKHPSRKHLKTVGEKVLTVVMTETDKGIYLTSAWWLEDGQQK